MPCQKLKNFFFKIENFFIFNSRLLFQKFSLLFFCIYFYPKCCAFIWFDLYCLSAHRNVWKYCFLSVSESPAINTTFSVSLCIFSMRAAFENKEVTKQNKMQKKNEFWVFWKLFSSADFYDQAKFKDIWTKDTFLPRYKQ